MSGETLSERPKPISNIPPSTTCQVAWLLLPVLGPPPSS
jgi:hypothetical protein